MIKNFIAQFSVDEIFICEVIKFKNLQIWNREKVFHAKKFYASNFISFIFRNGEKIYITATAEVSAGGRKDFYYSLQSSEIFFIARAHKMGRAWLYTENFLKYQSIKFLKD